MSLRSARRKLTLAFSPILVAGLLAVIPIATVVATPQPAHAAVSVGDLFFEHDAGSTQSVAKRSNNGAVTDLLAGQQPDVSPDGSRVAFVSQIGNSYLIEVANSDGSGTVPVDHPATNLSYDLVVDWFPRWSQDGKWITFIKEETYVWGHSWQAVKVRPDGSELTQLTYSTGYTTNAFPSWCLNGSKIVLSVDSGGTGRYRLYIMNADGTSSHLIDDSGNGGNQIAPVCSPDGSRIYYTEANSGTISYYTSSSGFSDTTATLNTFQNGRIQGNNARLSANGATMYYSANDSYSKPELYSVATGTTSSPTQLTVYDGTSNNISPSPVHAAWPNASTKNLVALGDSVVAGEGINYGYYWDNANTKWVLGGSSNPAWSDTTTALGANIQDCHQSGLAHPNLVFLSGGNYRLYNMACTGASAMAGILNQQTVGSTTVGAQLGGNCTGCTAANPLYDTHNPDKVILGVGADDITFADWVGTCYFPNSNCNTSANTTAVNNQLSTQKANLRLVLTELNRRAGIAGKTVTVVVTNYYNPFKSAYTQCIDTNAGILQGTYPGIGISPGEQSWLVDGLKKPTGPSLNYNIAQEVAYAQGHDTHLVVRLADISNVMVGHQYCDPDPWVYGPSIRYPFSGAGPANSPAPFHPTPAGQRAIEQVVAALL